MGGAETVTVNLASQMIKRGHSVQFIYLAGQQIVKLPDVITAHNLNMKKTPIGFVKALIKGRRIIKNYKPDVVHSNMFHAILFSRLLRLFVKIPLLICTEHSNNFHGKIRCHLEHITDGLSNLNTNVSKTATCTFVQNGAFSKMKSITMYNGIDLERFSKNNRINIRDYYSIGENDFVFLNIGRFNEAKDHKNLINAFSIVRNKFKNIRLICVGTGELEKEIKEYCNQLNLLDSIIFTGVKTNVEDFYHSCDCFVLSSAWEGLPLVVAEAMSSGIPVIATDCASEVLQNEEWTVPVKDAESLSKKMEQMILLPKDVKKNLIANNINSVQKFDINKICDKWMYIYSSLNRDGISEITRCI